MPLTLKESWSDRFVFEVDSAVSEAVLQSLLDTPVYFPTDDDDVEICFRRVESHAPQPPPPPPPPPRSQMVVTRLEIFHDAENCVVPSCEMVTKEDGSWVMEQGGTKMIPKIKQGKARHIQFEILKEKLLRRVVECAEGKDAAATKDITSLSFDWNFVLSFDRQGMEKWAPHQRVKQDMLDCGVRFEEPGTKDGAVDHKMKELLRKAYQGVVPV